MHNMHYTPSITYSTAFRMQDKPVHTINNATHGSQNDTRCRDGVNVLWCHSYFVWLVFEGSIDVFVSVLFSHEYGKLVDGYIASHKRSFLNEQAGILQENF